MFDAAPSNKALHTWNYNKHETNFVSMLSYGNWEAIFEEAEAFTSRVTSQGGAVSERGTVVYSRETPVVVALGAESFVSKYGLGILGVDRVKANVKRLQGILAAFSNIVVLCPHRLSDGEHEHYDTDDRAYSKAIEA